MRVNTDFHNAYAIHDHSCDRQHNGRTHSINELIFSLFRFYPRISSPSFLLSLFKTSVSLNCLLLSLPVTLPLLPPSFPPSLSLSLVLPKIRVRYYLSPGTTTPGLRTFSGHVLRSRTPGPTITDPRTI